MLYDVRTYECIPGRLAKQLEVYEQYGWQVQQKHLGKPLFYGVTETGLVNSYTHIWVYESAADRETKRAAMEADFEWQAYKKISGEAGHLVKQSNCLMTNAPFFKG